MFIRIVAVGRLKASAEKIILDDYIQRFNKLGRKVGFSPIDHKELDNRGKGGKLREADLILRATQNNKIIITLDERGQQLSSLDFATMLALYRDSGDKTLAFVIGGADGLHKSVTNSCSRSLSLGKMVWPHIMVRIMLAEQLFRAVSVLTGTPYHRA